MLAAGDGFDAGENFTHVHGLAHHVVHAGGEQLQRIVQGLRVIHRDDRGRRARFDLDRDFLAVLKIAQKECFNGIDIGLRRRVHPLPEVLRRQARGRHALAAKPGCVPVQDGFAIIDNYNHW